MATNLVPFTRSQPQAAIRDALDTLVQDGDVIELRVLGAGGKGRIDSGYFDNMDLLALSAAKYDGKVPGIYITLNPVQPALLSRAVNRVVEYAKVTTSDTDTLRRVWLPIDFDPVRPSGISSSKDEHEEAGQRAMACATWLRQWGFPDPILADSGNGAHLLYRISLPNDKDNKEASTKLVQDTLLALSLRFSDDLVSLDVSNFNAARIWKLYGTKACKGDSTTERPHRQSRIKAVPATIEAVSNATLARIAALVPHENKNAAKGYQGNGERVDVDAFLSRNNLHVSKQGQWQDGQKWVLETCPWNSDHTDDSAYIVQFPSGAVVARCHHNSCQGKEWRDLRQMLEPYVSNGHPP